MARNSLKSISKLIDSVNGKVSVEEMFLSDLKRSIEITANSSSRLPSKTYKPSSMTCIRNMWYQVMGVEPSESQQSYVSVGICGSGTDTHVRIQTAVEQMKDNGFDCEYIDVAEYVKSRNLDYLEIVSKSGMETKLYHKTLNMSFLCDGIIKYRNHYYILELKTETSYKWNMRKGVDEGHYAQGTAYSIAFDIPEVLFVYINRDISDMKSFMFRPTEEMKAELIDKITECDKFVKSAICPPKLDNISKKSCMYCGYVERCRREI